MSTALADRYSHAYYAYLADKDQTELAYNEFRWILEAIGLSPELHNFLEDPVIAPDRQQSILKGIFKDRVSDEMMRFLYFLVHKERLNILRHICRSYIDIYCEANGLIKATITTSVKISDPDLEQLCLKLKDRFHGTIIPEVEIDPELLGGLRVQVGDTIIDHSIRYQLEEFAHRVEHV